MSPRAAFVLFLCLSASMVHAQDWPQWRGPNRDGHSPDTNLELDWNEKSPELLWMVEGTGSGYASVSIANGMIYTTGNKDGAQCAIAMALEDGKPLWTRKLTDENPKHGYSGARCTPAVDGDRVYVITSDGNIACLNAADGKLNWSKAFKQWGGSMMSGWGYSESPLVDGDWVLCTPGGPDAMIVALNKMTGEEVWKSAAPASNGKGRNGAGYSSIVISQAAGVKQYVTLVGRGVIGVRASDGKLLWTYNRVANRTANIPTPICVGDYVFCSSGYGDGGSALVELSQEGDGVKATEKYWLDKRVLQNHHGGMIQLGNFVYCGHGHNKGFPACVEMATGKLKWGGSKLRGLGGGSAAVALVGKNLIFRYETGELALIEATPTGYELRGAIKPEYQKGKTWAHPVICGGKMYLREQDKLMCYQL
jgi:outer membrane protein assembly factor BamB